MTVVIIINIVNIDFSINDIFYDNYSATNEYHAFFYLS